MIKDLTAFYSKNALSMKRSEIRELLKVSRIPGMISFAGGLPASETFPVKELEDICCELLRQRGATALQYGTTEGEAPLREEISKWMMHEKSTVKPENILVTAGSQQGLDIVSKVFLNPKDIVVLELPSYIGGLQAFAAYRAKMIGVPQDEHGMRMDVLEKVLARLAKRKKKPKFIYVVPDFQNPSGVTLPLERRKKLLELAYQYEIPILEDSPYRDLRFKGKRSRYLQFRHGETSHSARHLLQDTLSRSEVGVDHGAFRMDGSHDSCQTKHGPVLPHLQPADRGRVHETRINAETG